MRDDRSAEGRKGRTPVTGVEMIGGREFNQLFAAGKSLRQLVGQMKSADDK